MNKIFFYSIFFLTTFHNIEMSAKHAVTLSAHHVAEQHGITTASLINNEGKECVVPQDCLSLLPSLHAINNETQKPIACGTVPSATLETISQALWSFYYAKQLPSFEIMQHVAQDAGLPWSTPDELTTLHQVCHALQFDLLDQLCQIPLVNLVSTKEGERQHHFAVPLPQALQSQKIKEYLQSNAFSVDKEVMLPTVSGQELQLLARTLWTMHENKQSNNRELLSQSIINDTSWGTTAGEQFVSAFTVIKMAQRLDMPMMAEVAALVMSTQGTEQQLTELLEELNNDMQSKIFITQCLLRLKPTDTEKAFEKIGFSIKERWHTSKHELVNNRLKGTRFDLSDIHINNLDGLHHLPGIRHVTELVLSDNKLKHVDTKHLSSLSSLSMIDLSHNSLKDLDVTPLLSLPALKTIKLRGNQFSEEIKQKISKQLSKTIEVMF